MKKLCLSCILFMLFVSQAYAGADRTGNTKDVQVKDYSKGKVVRVKQPVPNQPQRGNRIAVGNNQNTEPKARMNPKW